MDKRILIVDDAMFMRKIIRKILNEGGYQDVSEAQDGEEAMAVFRQVKPDLVLLDITMPGSPAWRSWRRCWQKNRGPES